MLKKIPDGRAGTPDEVAALPALIMGPEGGFITGSEFLVDGGATANIVYGPEARIWQSQAGTFTGDLNVT